ncbi:hypothetical protein OEV98_07455 [Caldibacillus lycopersici]|uniref:Uncharacterized protein n=1 Tax=Perspicuibacillus lycopersici TaxID=1325689 RepID=A0AAE3LMB1_9BACI|nr:hypothetical protein [Perspicuibacillus lycopersici]MCU9613390.1 hypothetical protein [Perspicuibacillus lycopersici]
MKKALLAIVIGIGSVIIILGIFLIVSIFAFGSYHTSSSQVVIGDIAENRMNFSINASTKENTEKIVMLNKNNKITFRNLSPGAKINVIITDSNDDVVFTKKIEQNSTYSFSSVSGEGNMELEFYKGSYKGEIEIEEE